MLDLLTVKTTSPTMGPQSSMGVSQTESIILCGRMGGTGAPHSSDPSGSQKYESSDSNALWEISSYVTSIHGVRK